MTDTFDEITTENADLDAVVQGRDEACAKELPVGITLEDFYAHMPTHKYVFIPTGETWPAGSINARLTAPAGNGGRKPPPASAWLDENRAVEQMTWAPGQPQIIEGRLISAGGWQQRSGVHVLNLYRPSAALGGDPNAAMRWVDHLRKVYPNEWQHIVFYLAHRVQKPWEKINHALVLGGEQGVGKDTLLEPIKYAVGPWNFSEIAPHHLLGSFSAYQKATVLRISEARDLGDTDRYGFYERIKTLTASPPDVLRVNEKFMREYYVPNVIGVIITTNHKSDGIYLPADDRRHFVAWSNLTKADFSSEYFRTLWDWYDAGGYGHVAAYLRTIDLSMFDPKEPPPKTTAFWEIVDANTAPEDAELADALDRLGKPLATTLESIARHADADLAVWLQDRKNRRAIPHRLERVGYTAVRNNAAKDGLWTMSGKRQRVYARKDLADNERLEAAKRLGEG